MLGAAASSHDTFGRFIAQSIDDDSAPEVDLLIRTGGEKRLSDFLLWESAYAELWFTDRMWPEFGVDDLKARSRRIPPPRAPLRRAWPLAAPVARRAPADTLQHISQGDHA